MAAGQGFKTFTTGEVLTAGDVNGYLMQGINVFASSSARSAAITSPQEGQYSYLKDTNALEYYDGSAWVGAPVGDITAVTAGKGLTGGGSSGDVTVSLATTAKGDLVAGSGASTAAVLSVGTNGQVLTADSTAATGLAWATASAGSTNVAGKNGLLNGSMNVWQRGTSITPGGGAYAADRWKFYDGSSVCVVSRQATNDTTNLPFIQYCSRISRPSGNTNTTTRYLYQMMESINAVAYAGKTVTLSFYARAGANFSASSGNLTYQVWTGTGTDQELWTSGYTGSATPINTTATLTTTWQRFSATATLASTTTELATSFNFIPTGTAGANDYFEITGVQLEIASSASAYSPNTPTYATELAACQRYYYRVTATQAYSDFGAGYNPNTTNASYMVPFPVSMRITPTAMEQTGTASDYNVLHSSGGSPARAVCSAVPSYQVATPTNCRVYFTVASGLTAGNGSVGGSNNNTNAYLGWSAEL